MSSSVNFTPYSTSGLIKQPSIVSINYTNQDFWSMKSRLIDFLKERFGTNGTELPGTFNDFVESSVAIMLIENWAFLADTLSFKMDQQINELFIDTVTEIENAFRLAKLVGFKPQQPIAASTMWTATLNATYSTDVTLFAPLVIPVNVGTVMINIELFPANSNNEPIFNQDIIIPAFSRINSSIIGLEGRTNTQIFTGTGQVSQSYTLPNYPVIFSPIQVSINNENWDQVESFTDSQPRKEYRVEFDSAYRGFIIFGNNRAGLIPPEGALINVTYRVGGGTIGNIVTGYVNYQAMGATEENTNGVPTNLNNYTNGKYGYDGATIDDIRSGLPLWVATQDRAVSGQDYKTLVDNFATPFHGKIGKSVAALRNYGCSGNIVDIYILALDGVYNLMKASDQLKTDLYTALDAKKMLTDYICIKDGTVIIVDVNIELTLDRTYQKFEEEIRNTVAQRINSFFSLNNWDYGKSLIDNDLIKSMSDIKQINGYTVMFHSDSQQGNIINVKFNEIIRTGQVSLSLLFQ